MIILKYIISSILNIFNKDIPKKDIFSPDINILGTHFGIYTATLDGNSVKQLIVNSTQDMSHIRVSPDKKWITFTRYNKKDVNDLAHEGLGYEQTEIMIAKIDGTNSKTIIPSKIGIVSANSSWMPDGKSLIFVSNNNWFRKGQIYKLNLMTFRLSRIPTPRFLGVADPHVVNDKIVFTAIINNINTLWIMQLDGKNLKQLTSPVLSQTQEVEKFKLGDYDPRISTDGSKIAYMRYLGEDNWHIIIIDIITGEEKDISPKVTHDVIPQWSSDDKLLMFGHVDKIDLSKTGIYRIKPDGSSRKQIPLSINKYFSYNKWPNFFPDEKSTDKTKIIYSAVNYPKILI